MSIHTTAENDPMRQQILANITCYKCGTKVIAENTVLVQPRSSVGSKINTTTVQSNYYCETDGDNLLCCTLSLVR